MASEFFANASEKRIYFDQKIFRREAAEGSIPEPFVAHGADAAFDGTRVGDAAKCGGDHVAVFERGSEGFAFRGIVP